ncbi:fibronectin type III domain-containing protein [Zobellia galactanivorans]|nr:fibronectin type III domain-containing protein [Zobellia galactanivorans]
MKNSRLQLQHFNKALTNYRGLLRDINCRLQTVLFHALFFFLLTLTCLPASAQSFPVQVIPQVTPPAPIYFSDYADASTLSSPLRVQIVLNDFEIANREIRLRTYFEGGGISFQSNDVVAGAEKHYLEGGVPLILTNVQLAPYFRFENISGISPNVYGKAIPEGAYSFCFEVYDALTGNRLSQKSCATSVVFQNEPPFLVAPRNKSNLTETNPQNIVFQWTPRHINVSNVEYELSIVEIWDTQVDPQQAFLSSPPVFQVTTTATTYVYGPADPLFLSGKNYAWRVQAKAKQGVEEIGLFKNQGYSEIYSFSYAGTCDLPIGINHEVKGSTNANIFWDDFATDVPEYTVRYRQKNIEGAEWFMNKTTSNQTTLWDLKAGTTYEYQVQKQCAVTGSDWSTAKEFTTFIADDEASVYDCGITPDFDVSNKEPLPSISSGEKFIAGDFPINILKVSGKNGRFTGKGYVTIPYLNSIRVGVEFTNVLINTDKKLAEGTVVTTYDPSLKNILDVDESVDTVEDAADAVGEFFEGDNDLDEIRVNWVLRSKKDIKIKGGKVVITNPNTGATKSEPLGDDMVITDSEGKTYYVDAEGKITEGGSLATGGAISPDTVEGVSNNGQIEALTAEGVLVTFNEAGTYAMDIMPKGEIGKLKDEYTIIKDADGNDYVLTHHAVKNRASTKIKAKIDIKNDAYDVSDVIFKTKHGDSIPTTFKGNEATLTLKGRFTFENEVIYAVVPNKDDSTKQLTAGAFTLWHLSERTVNVALVSVNGASLGNIESNVSDIFKKAVAHIEFGENLALSVTKDELGSNQKLDVGESAWAAAYNEEQKMLVNKVKQLPNYKTDTYYILVFNDIEPSRSIGGFMPLQRQMGFVFAGDPDKEEDKNGDKSKTLAHEIGHGIFALQHPFAEYDMSENQTDWLMDYGSGDQLPHTHWAQIHDPALKFYIFQDEEDGEIAGKTWFTPDWKPFTIKNSTTIISNSENISPKGTVPGFKLSNGTKYWAAYRSDGQFKGYYNDSGIEITKTEYQNKELTIDKNDIVYLFEYVPGDCNKTYRSTYAYVSSATNNISFDEFNNNIEQVNISTNCLPDLCEKGKKFYEDYTYLVKNEEGLTALLGISKLICSTGPDAIDYNILVTQIGKDAINTKNSFWWGTDKYLFDLAREQFWQNKDALPSYLNALESVASNIERFKKVLKTNASKEQYYNAIYYLNDKFLRSLSSIDKARILAHIFAEDTFITSGLYGITNNDESLIIKVLNSVGENKTEAKNFMDKFITNDDLYNDLQAGLDDNLGEANFTDFIVKLTKLAQLAYGNEDPSKIEPKYTFNWGVKNVDFVLRWVNTLGDYRFSYINNNIQLTGKCTTSYAPSPTGIGIIENENCLINNVPLNPFKDFVKITLIESVNILPSLCNNQNAQFCGQAIVVPAIFLEYLKTKKESQQFENLGFNIITVAGTILSGGELAAAKATTAAWYWAAADLTYTFSTPFLKLFREDVKKKFGEKISDFLYDGLDGIQFIFAAKGAADLIKTTPKNAAASIASKKVIGDDDFYKLLESGIRRDQPNLSEAKVKEIIDDVKVAMNKLESELSPKLLEEEIAKAKKLLGDYPSTNDWTSALDKNINDLTLPPKGYQFYTRNGNIWIRRIDASDLNTPRLTVKDGKITKYTGGTIPRFTIVQIGDYIKLATKNGNAKKVMLGMWDGGGPSSYITRAGNNYTYFDFGEKWDEVYKLVNENDDEIWRINKEFIDRQRAANKEFWFSHDPFSPKNEQFYAREINYLIDLGVTDFVKENDLWKALW